MGDALEEREPPDFAMLYTPCIVAILMIRREIGARWMWFDIGYQLLLAWLVAFAIVQIGGLLGLGHDQGDLIADKANHVRARLGRSGAAQHRLIRGLQAVLVDRHVASREHGHDAR